MQPRQLASQLASLLDAAALDGMASASAVLLTGATRACLLLQGASEPAVQQGSAAVADDFVAAPWLLPPRTPAQPWAGVHDLDRLLALQSRPVGGHNASVALLLFNRAFAELAQNSGG